MEKYSVMEMAMGAIEERVDYEMSRVVDNILDPNTKPDAKRKVTITLELTPNIDRTQIRVSATAKSTLVATAPVETALRVGTSKDGEIIIREIGGQVPGQMDMSGGEQEQPKILNFVKQA